MKYFVRIIPVKKTEAITLEWHGEHSLFTSPTILKMKLMDFYKEKLPSNPDLFVLGYIVKRGGKRGIEKELDLASMYTQFDKGDPITLYCEIKAIISVPKRKRKTITDSDSDVEDHESEVKKAADKLKEKHQENYDKRQLTLWGRMIVNKQWKSYDDPPDVPLITGGLRKFPRKETISEAITGAALAFAKAISPQTNQQSSKTPIQSGVSPMSKARVSSEYITQLKLLQQLRDCGVLSDDEFMEQKSIALDNIRSINARN